MDTLELFNRSDQKYNNLLPNVLLSENLFNNDTEKENIVEKNVVTAINTRLERAATFSQGLYLLENFISKISKECLTKNFPHWISKIMHILGNAPSNSPELNTVCKTITALIKSCKQVPELDKRISLYYVKQILNAISEKYEQKKDLNLLNLLTVLLFYYPESCIRLQVSYCSIISSNIDEEDSNFIAASAKCYALLVRASERTFINSNKNNYIIQPDNSHASCQIYYQINLCHCLHNIMDELFQNFVTVTSDLPSEFQRAKNNSILELPEITQENVFEYYADNVNRFTNICTFLSTLLQVGSTGKKYVLPKVILHVVCRGLSVTPVNLQKSEEHRKDLLLLVLPKLYTGIFNVLEALITSFQQELVPHAFNIEKLILQTLEWTQQFYRDPFKNVRLHAYKILSVWVKQTLSLSGFQLIADEVLLHILKDMSLSTAKVSMLKTNKNSSKNNSKKDKFMGNKKEQNKDNSDSNITHCSDTILQLQVLSTIESIVSHANHYLKQSFYDRIRNTVVLLLYEQYTKNASSLADKNNTVYRLQLLKTLRVLETYARGSSSTSHAIHIFGIAISHDNNSEIMEEARLGLAELRHVIYPTAPTLMLPLSEYLDEQTLPSQSLRMYEVIDSLGKRSLENDSSDENELKKRPKSDEKNL